MLKNLVYYSTCILLLIGFIACEQTEKPKKVREPRDLHNDMFNWSINVPQNFEKVSPEEWEKSKAKNLDEKHELSNDSIENRAKTIFTFRSGDLNYLESNYQPYNIEENGPYLNSIKEVNKILYNTFQAQMPNMQIDSSTSVEKISDLEFQIFALTINFSEKVSLKSKVYSRLFEDKELTVNIMYVDSTAGTEMIDVWKNSIF